MYWSMIYVTFIFFQDIINRNDLMFTCPALNVSIHLQLPVNTGKDTGNECCVTGKRGNVEINNSPQAGIEPGASRF